MIIENEIWEIGIQHRRLKYCFKVAGEFVSISIQHYFTLLFKKKTFFKHLVQGDLAAWLESGTYGNNSNLSHRMPMQSIQRSNIYL